jgi:hypothetical protein
MHAVFLMLNSTQPRVYLFATQRQAEQYQRERLIREKLLDSDDDVDQALFRLESLEFCHVYRVSDMRQVPKRRKKWRSP